MPNYSLDTTGAVFQPFSFKELIEPYEMMRVAEEKLQNDYITLSDNIGQWQGAVASSPTLSAQLQKYQDDVMAATQELQETGRLDRSKFVNLRKRMMSEISPIKTAVDNYNKALDLDTKMRSADGTYIAKRQVPTLEDFANGETRYSGGISGNTVFQRASAAGKELSKDKKAILDGYIGDGAFVKMAQESGIPAEQLALQAIKAGNAPKEVIDIYNSLRDSIGYGEYDQTGRDMIDANIHLGLLSASKERTEALQRNPHDEWVSSYQKAQDEWKQAMAERQFNFDVASHNFVETSPGVFQYDVDQATQQSLAKKAGDIYANNTGTIQVPQGYETIASTSDVFDNLEKLLPKDEWATPGNVWQSKDGTKIIVQMGDGTYKHFEKNKKGELIESDKEDSEEVKMETRKVQQPSSYIGIQTRSTLLPNNYGSVQDINIPSDINSLKEATIGLSINNQTNTDNQKRNTDTLKQDLNEQTLNRRKEYAEKELNKINNIISKLEQPARNYILKKEHNMSVGNQSWTKEEEEAYTLLQLMKQKKDLFEQVLHRKEREIMKYKQKKLNDQRSYQRETTQKSALKEATEYLKQ